MGVDETDGSVTVLLQVLLSVFTFVWNSVDVGDGVLSQSVETEGKGSVLVKLLMEILQIPQSTSVVEVEIRSGLTSGLCLI